MSSIAVQIANIALNNLGDKTISAFSDKSAQAFATKDRLTDIINSVLRAHPWNCMTKRDTLTQLGTTPKYKFDYAYSLPTDSLRVLSLKEEEDYDYACKIEIIHHYKQYQLEVRQAVARNGSSPVLQLDDARKLIIGPYQSDGNYGLS